MQESDCASSGQVCKAYQCVACQVNSDCTSQICDAYGDLGGAGRCVTPSQTYFIDNNDSNQEFCGTADGSAKHPFCTIAEALSKLTASTGSGPTFLRVQASPNAYGLPALAALPNQLVLTGPGSLSPGRRRRSSPTPMMASCRSAAAARWLSTASYSRRLGSTWVGDDNHAATLAAARPGEWRSLYQRHRDDGSHAVQQQLRRPDL